MDWLIPSVVATLTGSLALAFVYEFLYQQDRESYLRAWAWGWMAYVLRFVFMLAMAVYHETVWLFFGNQWFVLLSGLLLLWGMYQFIEHEMPRIWWFGTLVGGIWIAGGMLLDLPFLVVTLPTFTFLALVYIWTGIIFLRKAPNGWSGYHLAGWTFILWGVHKANYPILRPVAWFAPWGYLLAAVFELLTALSILMVHFDKMRGDLLASQSTLTAFARALPDLGLIMDHDGVYVDIITSQNQLLAADADTLRGRRMHEVLPPDVAARVQEAILLTLTSGTNQVIEYMLAVPAGRRWFEGHLSLMRRTGPAQGEVVLIARDITERKEWDQTLEQSNEQLRTLHQQIQDYAQTLEQRVSERTAELNEMNQRLQELARTKDEFVSNVSHELRSPITSLKLRQYLLARHPDQLDDHLPVIERETIRLEHTIEDLLTLSRMDQGRMQMNLNTVDLNALVEAYYYDRMRLAREQGLALHMHCDPGLPLVRADDGLLSQVVDILLTNAFNYTPSGGTIMLGTLTTQVDGRCWVGMRVSDTGLGINPEEHDQLFDRFYRGRAARQSKVSGTGLGLSIARSIVDRHGGRIDIVSSGTSGEGTTFTVWLLADESLLKNPLVQTKADAGRGEASAQEVGGMEARSPSGHTQE